jgi:hypothetical protein
MAQVNPLAQVMEAHPAVRRPVAVYLLEHLEVTDGQAMRDDLPGGVGPLYVAANGVEHVVVLGGAVVTSGELTTRLPPWLQRSGPATYTASLN